MLTARLMFLAVPMMASLGYLGASPARWSSHDTANAGFSDWSVQAADASRLKRDEHGLRLPVEVQIVPKQVRVTSAGEALDLDLDLLNTTGGQLATIVSYEVFDDLGNTIVSKVIGPKADVPGTHQAKNQSPGIPEALANGYYFAKATVAWKGPDGQGTASDSFYFRVKQRRIQTVSADDWSVESRVNQGVAQ